LPLDIYKIFDISWKIMYIYNIRFLKEKNMNIQEYITNRLDHKSLGMIKNHCFAKNDIN